MCWLAKATFTRPEFYCDRSCLSLIVYPIFYNGRDVLV